MVLHLGTRIMCLTLLQQVIHHHHILSVYYIGVYNNAFYGKINVTVVNNGTNDNLVFYYGNNSVPFTLRHYNYTVFTDDANLASF